MKILHTADWHLNDMLGRVDRTEDLRRRVERVAELCDEHRVDVLLIAGDLFSDQATAEQVAESFRHLRATFAGFFDRGGTILAVTGNHDQDRRVHRPLKVARAGMLVADTPVGQGDHFRTGRAYLLDGRNLMVVGKRFGVTNLVVLDAAGRTLFDSEVVVSAGSGSMVSITRGVQNFDYACTPNCQQVAGEAPTVLTPPATQTQAPAVSAPAPAP